MSRTDRPQRKSHPFSQLQPTPPLPALAKPITFQTKSLISTLKPTSNDSWRGFCEILQLPLPTTTPPLSDTPHQTDPQPTPITQQNRFSTALRSKSVDLNRQTHHDQNNPAQPPSKPRTPPPPQLLMRQLPMMLPPTPQTTEPDPSSIKPTEPTECQTATTRSNTPTPYNHSDPPLATTTAAAHSAQPYFSAMERMLNNNTPTNEALWIPDALKRRQPRNMETCQFPLPEADRIAPPLMTMLPTMTPMMMKPLMTTHSPSTPMTPK